MSRKEISYVSLRLFYLYFLLFICIMSLYSCNSQKKVKMAKMGTSLDSMYLMMTRNVDMIISDSGVTRYKMKAKVWYIYDREDKKQWYFPEGLTVSSLDTTINNKSYLRADTGIYYTDLERWELIGHVEFWGQNGSKLFTPRLFWNKSTREVYSNDSTYFYTEGKELRGQSFSAMDDLSKYTIYNNKGKFDIDENPNVSRSDSSSEKDSLHVEKKDNIGIKRNNLEIK